MIKFLKLLGKGLLYILLIPLGLVVLVCYGVYLLVVWFVMFVRSFILFLSGKPSGLTLKEDEIALKVLEGARDFSQPENPQPQQQPQPQQVTFTLNINGQPLNATINQKDIIENQVNESLENKEIKEIDLQNSVGREDANNEN